VSVLSEHVEQSKQAVGTGLPVLPRVNLLPPEIGERVRIRRIQYGLGGGVLAAVGVVALLFLGANASVNDANTELETATASGTALQAESAKYTEVKAVYAQAAAAEAMLTKAMGEEVLYSEFLYGLGLTIPDRAWLTNAKFKQGPPEGVAATAVAPGIGTVTFTGVGFTHDDVAAWLDGLAKQEGFKDPYFTESVATEIGTRNVVEFNSLVLMTADALSGRYTKPAGG